MLITTTANHGEQGEHDFCVDLGEIKVGVNIFLLYRDKTLVLIFRLYQDIDECKMSLQFP